MERYNIGDVWWIHFPFSDKDEVKRRPAIVIETIGKRSINKGFS